MVDRIILYYELSNIIDDFIMIIRFENKIDKFEIDKYIMECKQNLSSWDLYTILEEIEKKYKVKSFEEIAGYEFIGI